MVVISCLVIYFQYCELWRTFIRVANKICLLIYEMEECYLAQTGWYDQIFISQFSSKKSHRFHCIFLFFMQECVCVWGVGFHTRLLRGESHSQSLSSSCRFAPLAPLSGRFQVICERHAIKSRFSAHGSGEQWWNESRLKTLCRCCPRSRRFLIYWSVKHWNSNKNEDENHENLHVLTFCSSSLPLLVLRDVLWAQYWNA